VSARSRRVPPPVEGGLRAEDQLQGQRSHDLALETASRRQKTLETVTISIDAQAAIRRMASEEPGPGQMHALQARKHIAALRRAKPSITIEIKWCPARKGVTENEKADKWAKLAAEEPDARGVKWLGYSDRAGARAMPLPRSLAHLEREITEKKWAEPLQWARRRTFKKKYRMPKSQRQYVTVAESAERLASRCYRLKTGHCPTGQYLRRTKNRPTAQCWWCRCQTQTREHLFKRCPRMEGPAGLRRWKSRWRIQDLLVDGGWSQAVLDFPSTYCGGGGLVPAEDDAGSDFSEWELRELQEREEERRAEVAIVPTLALLHGIHRRCEGGRSRFLLSFFFISFPL